MWRYKYEERIKQNKNLSFSIQGRPGSILLRFLSFYRSLPSQPDGVTIAPQNNEKSEAS